MDSHRPQFRNSAKNRALTALATAIVLAMLSWGAFKLFATPSTEQIVADRRLIATTLRLTANVTAIVGLSGLLVLSVSTVVNRMLGIFFRRGSLAPQALNTCHRKPSSSMHTVLLRIWFVVLPLWLTLEVTGIVMFVNRHKPRHQPTLETRHQPILKPRLSPKTDDRFVLWAVGGSTMEGWPYSDITSIPSIVGMQLWKAFPELKIQVNNFAFGGAKLEDMIHLMSKERDRPDVLLIYAGHNEINHRFNVNRRVRHLSNYLVFNGDFSIFASQMARELQRTTRPNDQDRQLFDDPLCTPEELENIYSYFQQDLEQLLLFCEREKILAVCITPASNESGLEPNRSVLPDDFPEVDKNQLKGIFEQLASQQLDAKARFSLLNEAITLAPGFAESWYQLAQLHHSRGEIADAIVCYQRARDLDGCVVRATSRINESYEEATDRFGCILLDGSAVLRPLTNDGVLGNEVIHDELHLNLRSQVALSNAIVNAIRSLGIPSKNWPMFFEPTTVAKVSDHFRIHDDDWHHVYKRMANQWSYLKGMRYDQKQRLETSRVYNRACERIREGKYKMRYGMPELDFASH